MEYASHTLRLQRRRTKGFELPYGTVCVTRPGKWRNCFSGPEAVEAYREAWRHIRNNEPIHYTVNRQLTIGHRTFNATLLHLSEWAELLALRDHLPKLKNRRLACYCPLDRPCHADVLCELANDEVSA